MEFDIPLIGKVRVEFSHSKGSTNYWKIDRVIIHPAVDPRTNLVMLDTSPISTEKITDLVDLYQCGKNPANIDGSVLFRKKPEEFERRNKILAERCIRTKICQSCLQPTNPGDYRINCPTEMHLVCKNCVNPPFTRCRFCSKIPPSVNPLRIINLPQSDEKIVELDLPLIGKISATLSHKHASYEYWISDRQIIHPWVKSRINMFCINTRYESITDAQNSKKILSSIACIETALMFKRNPQDFERRNKILTERCNNTKICQSCLQPTEPEDYRINCFPRMHLVCKNCVDNEYVSCRYCTGDTPR
jgi:hypothetical protein